MSRTFATCGRKRGLLPRVEWRVRDDRLTQANGSCAPGRTVPSMNESPMNAALRQCEVVGSESSQGREGSGGLKLYLEVQKTSSKQVGAATISSGEIVAPRCC